MALADLYRYAPPSNQDEGDADEVVYIDHKIYETFRAVRVRMCA
jgi:hypothetical protein